MHPSISNKAFLWLRNINLILIAAVRQFKVVKVKRITLKYVLEIANNPYINNSSTYPNTKDTRRACE